MSARAAGLASPPPAFVPWLANVVARSYAAPINPLPKTIMLDTLRAEDFSHRIGQTCRLTSEAGWSLELVVDSVTEHARLKRPQDTRAPFSVLLKGPQEPSFVSGLFDIELEPGISLHGVGIGRIMPPWGINAESAYYQIAFN